MLLRNTILVPFLMPLLTHALSNTTMQSYYYESIGYWGTLKIPLPGVEIKPPCWSEMNDILSNTSEYDKVGSSASISLLALLPAVLVLGPVPTAELSNLFIFSPMMGIVTAGMTLGLPVKSVSPTASVIKVKDLFLPDGSRNNDNLIATYGLVSSSVTAGLRHHSPVTRLDQFHRWYSLPTPFAKLRQQVFTLQSSSMNRLGGMMFITSIGMYLTLMQYLILFFLSWTMRSNRGQFLWTCPEFGAIIQSSALGTGFIIGAFIYSIISLRFQPVKNTYYLTPAPSWFEPNQCLCCSLSSTLPIWKKRIPYHSRFNSLFRSCCRILRNVSSSTEVKRFFIRILRSTKESWNTPPPLVVQLRLVSSGPHPFKIAILGLLRLIIIIPLTFLLSSIYGGKLYATFLFVSVFCIAIAVSRILSIAGAEFMARIHRLTIIECGNEAEMRGIERLLGSMPGVVIGKRRGWGGWKFWEGRRYCGGWAVDMHWKEDTWLKVPGLAGLQAIFVWVQLSLLPSLAILNFVPYGLHMTVYILSVVRYETMMQMRGVWGVWLINDE
ncbi:hypothetical protein BZA77DRAFT_25423 [Pyronema omphalodes]|nr:hypothetical protein BZA77DRAFT_25423 [Pyronema omphalodes]